MLGAVMFGHQSFQPVIHAIIELAETCAKEPWALPSRPPNKAAIEAQAARRGRPDARRRLCASAASRTRSNQLDAAKAQGRRRCSPTSDEQTLAGKLFKDLEKDIVRGAILDGEPRIDGRDTKTVRPISCEVGVLPRAHGSALFTRGETQALVVADARHRPGRADHRRARRRVPRELHAALQLPALFDRRGRPHGLARAARDRPRQARLARGASAAAGEGKLPLHDPRRLRDHRSRTARRRWPRCAAPRCR